LLLLTTLLGLTGCGSRDLDFRTPPTDPEFVSAQALTIQTHFFTGLTLTLALLYAAWWR
jgi:hypothetical protein